MARTGDTLIRYWQGYPHWSALPPQPGDDQRYGWLRTTVGDPADRTVDWTGFWGYPGDRPRDYVPEDA